MQSVKTAVEEFMKHNNRSALHAMAHIKVSDVINSVGDMSLIDIKKMIDDQILSYGGYSTLTLNLQGDGEIVSDHISISSEEIESHGFGQHNISFVAEEC